MKFHNFTLAKITAVIIGLALCFVSCSSDEESNMELNMQKLYLVKSGDGFVPAKLDSLPVYIDGGDKGYSEAVFDILKYPALARERGVEGYCNFTYIVYSTGAVGEIKIITDPGAGIGDETLRALSTVFAGIPFRPAILNNKAVTVKLSGTIKFEIL